MYTVIGINNDAKIEFQHHTSAIFSTRQEAVDYINRNRSNHYFWHILETIDVIGPSSTWPRTYYRDRHGRMRASI